MSLLGATVFTLDFPVDDPSLPEAGARAEGARSLTAGLVPYTRPWDTTASVKPSRALMDPYRHTDALQSFHRSARWPTVPVHENHSIYSSGTPSFAAAFFLRAHYVAGADQHPLYTLL